MNSLVSSQDKDKQKTPSTDTQTLRNEELKAKQAVVVGTIYKDGKEINLVVNKRMPDFRPYSIVGGDYYDSCAIVKTGNLWTISKISFNAHNQANIFNHLELTKHESMEAAEIAIIGAFTQGNVS